MRYNNNSNNRIQKKRISSSGTFPRLANQAPLENNKNKQDEQINKLAQNVKPNQKELVKELYSMILQDKNIDKLEEKDLNFKVGYYKKTMLAHLSAEVLTHGMTPEEENVFYTSYNKIQDKNNDGKISLETIKELRTQEPYKRILAIQLELLTHGMQDYQKDITKTLVKRLFEEKKSVIDNRLVYELQNMTVAQKINIIAKEIILPTTIQSHSQIDDSEEETQTATQNASNLQPTYSY